MYGNGRTSVNDDDWVPEWRYGLSGAPEIFFSFSFFFTYFVILTDADAVPNSHK
jgi:hypothetical protein